VRWPNFGQVLGLVVFGAVLAGPSVLWTQNIPGAGPALAQEAEEKDAVQEALQTVRQAADPEASQATGFTWKLDQARRTLVEKTDEALPHVTGLLKDENVQVRLNAAIVLAQMAEAGSADPRLVEALKRCLEDPCPALVYWGLRGMLAGQMPLEEKLAAAAECLKLEHPRPLRVAAAGLLKEKGLKEAAPLLVEYLQRILPAYKNQRDEALTYRVTQPGPGYPGAGEYEAPFGPGAGYGPPGRGYGVPGGVPGEEYGLPGGEYGLPGGYGPAEGYGGLGREYGQPPGPGEGRAGVPGRRVIERRIDPERLTYQQRMNLIYELESLPAVMELHQVGLALEELLRSGLRESPFGFGETPPWSLDQCVERAVAWLEQTRGAAPAEAPEKPATEEGQPAEEEPAAAEP